MIWDQVNDMELQEPISRKEASEAYWNLMEWALFESHYDKLHEPSLARFAGRIIDIIDADAERLPESIEEFRKLYKLPQWIPGQELPPKYEPFSPGSKLLFDRRRMDAIRVNRENEEWAEIARHLSYSFVVIAYSYLERSLITICRELYTCTDFPQGCFKGFTGMNKIGQAQNYMKNTLHLSFPDDHGDWKKLIVLKMIRDAAVHSDGQLTANEQERVLHYSERMFNSLSVSTSGKVDIGRPYPQQVLNQLAGFFKALHCANKDRLAEIGICFVASVVKGQ